jgi:hypothetical protein
MNSVRGPLDWHGLAPRRTRQNLKAGSESMKRGLHQMSDQEKREVADELMMQPRRIRKWYSEMRDGPPRRVQVFHAPRGRRRDRWLGFSEDGPRRTSHRR